RSEEIAPTDLFRRVEWKKETMSDVERRRLEPHVKIPGAKKTTPAETPRRTPEPSGVEAPAPTRSPDDSGLYEDAAAFMEFLEKAESLYQLKISREAKALALMWAASKHLPPAP